MSDATTTSNGRAGPLLAARHLEKTYRLGKVNVPVLRDASVEVRRGEWLAILGASGSGKSTLLHLLGGLDRPDRRGRGSIVFDGRPLEEMAPRQLDRYRAGDVGFIFQFYHLLPELTVMENVLVGAMVRHGRVGFARRRRELRERAGGLLETVGLGHRLRHRPVELSGGERQRVAIARALINEPALLLADEPTGNLDRPTGRAVLDALQRIREQLGQTMVVVTHDRGVAELADRVVHLHDGRVVAGPPEGVGAAGEGVG